MFASQTKPDTEQCLRLLECSLSFLAIIDTYRLSYFMRARAHVYGMSLLQIPFMYASY